MLRSMLDPIFRRETRRYWMALLSEAGIPFGEIKTGGEVCCAGQFVECGIVHEVHRPTAGNVRYIANPVPFDDRALEDAIRPPRLGEHTAQLLGEWLSPDRVRADAYAAAGAFGPQRRFLLAAFV